jgi:hypothetical protein
VLSSLREDHAAAGKAKLFEILKVFIVGEGVPGSYEAAAADLAVSEGAVRVAVHRLRRRYRERLQEEVARTLEDPADVQKEIRYLFSALGS